MCKNKVKYFFFLKNTSSYDRLVKHTRIIGQQSSVWAVYVYGGYSLNRHYSVVAR